MTKINLNGSSYNLETSRLKLSDSLPDWEQEIFLFLVDWFSDEDFIIVQSSGSTGVPKKIKTSKQAMRNSALMTGDFFNFKPNDKALLCLPAKFIAGKMMLVRAITWDLNLTYIEPKIEMEIPLKNFTFSAMTPQQVKANLAQLNHINTLIIGGAPIDPELEKELKKTPANSFATYGMTETVSHIAVREIKLNNTEFQVLPNITISKDERDCLVINAPKLHDKQLITNDLVDINSPNSFSWKGRIDNVINTGGIKISPEDLEFQIAPYMNQPFFVFGIPDKKWGEQVILILERKKAVPNDLLEKTNALLEKHVQIKKVLTTPKFIRTENGKIQRKETFLKL